MVPTHVYFFRKFLWIIQDDTLDPGLEFWGSRWRRADEGNSIDAPAHQRVTRRGQPKTGSRDDERAVIATMKNADDDVCLPKRYSLPELEFLVDG